MQAPSSQLARRHPAAVQASGQAQRQHRAGHLCPGPRIKEEQGCLAVCLGDGGKNDPVVFLLPTCTWQMEEQNLGDQSKSSVVP